MSDAAAEMSGEASEVEPADLPNAMPDPDDEEAEGNLAPGRQRVERLWDDDGFRARVAETATRRGYSIRETLIGAGTSPRYMEPSPNGRNTAIVMRVAKFLDVHPAYLMFNIAGPAEASPATAAGTSSLIGSEQRLALVGQIIAAHWLHIALDPKGAAAAAAFTVQQVSQIITIATR